MDKLLKLQHAVSSALYFSHNMRLTALRTVSCYRVSAWPNRAAEEGSCSEDLLRRMDALPSDWKVLQINNSCLTDFSAGYPATSGSI